MMLSFPECAVCGSPFKYKGPEPYLLPCLHDVCSNCLDPECSGSAIRCTVCHRSHNRINQSFPVDHVALAEVLDLTVQHRPSEISCTNKEDGNQAVCWCEECSDFLCEHCQSSHVEVKVTRAHKIWNMSEFSQTLKKCHSKCISHALPETIYDKDCGNFICSQCFFIDHANHSVVTLEESATSEDAHLKENLDSVSEKKDEVLQSTKAVDAQTNFLEDISSCLRERVKHTFSELRSLLNQREKVILLELDQLMECMNTINNSRRPVLKGTETSCQVTLDYINKCLLSTPPQQLHQLKSSIVEATQFCINANVPQVHKQEGSVAFSKQGLQDLRSAVSSFGSFLAPNGEKDQPDEFTSFQSARMNSLKKTIENLKVQTTERSKKLKTLTKEVSKRRDQIQELDQIKKRSTDEISQMRNQIQELDQIKKHSTKEISQMRNQLQEFEEIKKHSTKEISQMRNQLQEFEEIKKHSTKEISQMRNQLQEFEEIKKHSTKEISQMRNQLQEFEEIKKCLTREVTKREEHVQELEKREIIKRDQIKKLEERFKFKGDAYASFVRNKIQRCRRKQLQEVSRSGATQLKN